jgi:hypothetical protein
MRRIDAAALVLLAICLGGLLVHLGNVPALSLDEAWLGNFSLRLRALGSYTPHQMNHYTGPLYSWGLAGMTKLLGYGVFQIRLMGAVLNALALVGLWLHLRRRVSPEAGAAWAVLAAASAYFLMKSRLAWEVYALQPILILATLSLLAKPGRGAVALTALTMLGVQNHFIYLSIPASLVILFSVRAAWLKEEEALKALRPAVCALTAGIVLAAIKHPISDEAWVAHRWLLGSTMAIVPTLAAAAAWRLPFTLLLGFVTQFRRELTMFFGLTVLAFFIWHVAPLVQIFAGPVVFKRMFALTLPLPLSFLLHVWGLFLVAVLIWQAVRAWHGEKMTFHERTLLLWPAAFSAVFIVFRHTSSLRYYNLPWMICAPALAASLPRLARVDKKAIYLCAGFVALITQGLLWREIIAPAERTPLKFRVGWRKENSYDFARKEGLFAAFDASNACQIGHSERSFSAIPLFFHRYEKPLPNCDPKLIFDADQCPQCAQPPYYRWTIVPAAK